MCNRYLFKLTLLICCFVHFKHTASISWYQKKASHKPKTLNAAGQVSVAQQSNSDQMQLFKTEILAPFLRVRVSDTDGNRAVQQHIHSQIRALDWQIYDDTFTSETPDGQKTFTNIVATQNTSASRQLTLACHYDSKLFTDFVFIGAIDSAVPCAMMIDIARLLNRYLATPQRSGRDVSLQLIFFDGEEALHEWTDTDSLYGSRHLADKMSSTSVQVEREVFVSEVDTMDALILLDLIGTSQTRFNKMYSSTNDLYDRLRFIERKMSAAGIISKNRPIFSTRTMTSYGGIQDDHIPFLKKGVPVMHLISMLDGSFPRVWHTVDDNEASLDYQLIDDLEKILRVFVVEYLHLNV